MQNTPEIESVNRTKARSLMPIFRFKRNVNINVVTPPQIVIIIPALIRERSSLSAKHDLYTITPMRRVAEDISDNNE